MFSGRVKPDYYEDSSGSDDEEEDGVQEKERSYVALHNMLLILDDPDPTLRLSCRSWLQESKADYLRILDPLLKEFMDNNRMYRSFSGQLFFLNNYDSSVVIENFTKLRNIIFSEKRKSVGRGLTLFFKLGKWSINLFERNPS